MSVFSLVGDNFILLEDSSPIEYTEKTLLNGCTGTVQKSGLLLFLLLKVSSILKMFGLKTDQDGRTSTEDCPPVRDSPHQPHCPFHYGLVWGGSTEGQNGNVAHKWTRMGHGISWYLPILKGRFLQI